MMLFLPFIFDCLFDFLYFFFLKADAPHIIMPPKVEPLLSSGSILRVVERPLPQGSGHKSQPPLFVDMQRCSIGSSGASISKLSNQDTCELLQEILQQLDMLELSRETQNYIRIKLSMYYANEFPYRYINHVLEYC